MLKIQMLDSIVSNDADDGQGQPANGVSATSIPNDNGQIGTTLQ
ncbi:unnamed protein product [Plutella xylostella]|uniref:(diamondback moth) hypothetical protein n=1 Tax=Plutella xylostella TaxID=51655 RepID=A0A8S4E7B5_PLUXY|nr:unnamed protein product [Plutella xylostella]